jgi:hypothetical protein
VCDPVSSSARKIFATGWGRRFRAIRSSTIEGISPSQAPGRSSLSDADCRRLSGVARRALIFSEEGQAHLVQRRHGDGDYSYLAIKARTPARRTR